MNYLLCSLTKNILNLSLFEQAIDMSLSSALCTGGFFEVLADEAIEWANSKQQETREQVLNRMTKAVKRRHQRRRKILRQKEEQKLEAEEKQRQKEEKQRQEDDAFVRKYFWGWVDRAMSDYFDDYEYGFGYDVDSDQEEEPPHFLDNSPYVPRVGADDLRTYRVATDCVVTIQFLYMPHALQAHILVDQGTKINDNIGTYGKTRSTWKMEEEDDSTIEDLVKFVDRTRSYAVEFW
jgi:hypothetical protein